MMLESPPDPGWGWGVEMRGDQALKPWEDQAKPTAALAGLREGRGLAGVQAAPPPELFNLSELTRCILDFNSRRDSGNENASQFRVVHLLCSASNLRNYRR